MGGAPPLFYGGMVLLSLAQIPAVVARENKKPLPESKTNQPESLNYLMADSAVSCFPLSILLRIAPSFPRARTAHTHTPARRQPAPATTCLGRCCARSTVHTTRPHAAPAGRVLPLHLPVQLQKFYETTKVNFVHKTFFPDPPTNGAAGPGNDARRELKFIHITKVHP